MATDEDVKVLAGHIATLATKLAETNERELGYQQKLTLCRTLTHVHHCALLALAQTHPQKQQALELLQKLWNSARGGLGTAGVSDETRRETQTHLDQIAQALGGKIL